MTMDLTGRTAQLHSRRTPYVMATVVRAERPTSAKPGDAALVLPDGSLEGFVGGTCAESTVRQHGLRLLRTGESTLLRITPDEHDGHAGHAEAEGVITVANPCLSGGTLEIFLEARIPAVLVHVLGDGPIALALARIGRAAGYAITVTTDPEAPIAPDARAVVVASHGRDELAVLRAALTAGVPYVALVASRRRGAAVLAELGRVDGAERVHTPAGLDIGARTAPEVALSILAELIASRPRRPAPHAEPAPHAPGAAHCCHS
jgi:xanthine dehydrogenase accessory factor